MITDTLATQSTKIRELGEALVARIVAFEAFLNTLKGKTETIYKYKNESGEFFLKFHREGKLWVISASNGAEFMLLQNCSLKVKINSIYEFDNLLTALTKSNEEIIQRVEACNKHFDSWFALINSQT